MTKFIKEQFNWDGEYLSYNMAGLPNGQTRKFVARFKRNKGDRAHFVSFLIKNFSVEEYFRDYDAGGTPVGIMEQKGYVSKTIQKNLKLMGYAPTREGFKAYIDSQVAKYAK